MEVWLAPIAGTRVLVPFRMSIPTPLGRRDPAGDPVHLGGAAAARRDREDAVGRCGARLCGDVPETHLSTD